MPNILFASIHASDIYPHTGGDDVKRASNIVNVPLASGTGSLKFQQEFQKIIVALEQFQPTILFLSSGFDGHKKDPTGYLI